jgi:general secretion pathway protein G
MKQLLKSWSRHFRGLKAGLAKGFTLIELLIVIAIIGILTALVTTNLQGVRQRARDTRRKSDLRAIQQSLRLFYNDAKEFPSSNASFEIVGCGSIAIPVACPWGDPFATTENTYMGSLPLDPSSNATSITYQYYASGDDQYAIVAKLENLSDQDIADSQTRCQSVYSSFNGDKDQTTDYVACAQ